MELALVFTLRVPTMSTTGASSVCQWLDFVKAVALANKLSHNLPLGSSEGVTSDPNTSITESSVDQDINHLKEPLSRIYNSHHEEKDSTTMPADIEEHSSKNKNPCGHCKQSRKKVRDSQFSMTLIWTDSTSSSASASLCQDISVRDVRVEGT